MTPCQVGEKNNPRDGLIKDGFNLPHQMMGGPIKYISPLALIVVSGNNLPKGFAEEWVGSRALAWTRGDGGESA